VAVTEARTPDAILRVGGREIAVLGPRLTDPRLHLAAIILSIHTLGITVLGFRVSVPQILAAILTGALIEAVVTVARTGTLSWPASGMLTGSGVALILRLPWMESGRYWELGGWYLFAGIAAVSVLSKYLLRFRGEHLFNPSNFGLVLAFLVLGSTVVEPLDFWWAPLGPWMVLAYAVIIGGGIALTRRLDLLKMSAVAWGAFAIGLGVLAVSGHCMTATWSPDPVCDARFWSVLVTSPELLIFLFFMITDPATIPRRPGARLGFALVVAALSTLLIAPQSLEFGAKVGLLAGLVALTPFRFLFDRVRFGDLVGRRPASAGFVAGALVATLGVGIVVAGSSARPAPVAALASLPDIEVDATLLPVPTVAPGMEMINAEIDPGALALVLAENLAYEAAAVTDLDPTPLYVADARHRLEEMLQVVADAVTTGERVVTTHRFDSLHLRPEAIGEGQGGAGVAFDAIGTRIVRVLDADGVVVDERAEPLEATYVLTLAGSDRWQIALVTE
jgi:hypothetical protein